MQRLASITKLPPLYLLAALFINGLLLTACSPDPESREPLSDDATEENYANNSYDYDESSYGQDLEAQGWRSGKLHVQFELHQKAKATEKGTDNSIAHSEWETVIQGASEQVVWVVPDLTVMVPDGDDEERRSAMQSSPYYVEDSMAAANVSGTVRNALAFEYLKPDAVDYKRITRTIDEQGTVRELSLFNMHPSLYGQGYEVKLTLIIDTQRKASFMGVPAGNGEVVVENTDTEESETIKLYLYPIPNTNGLNDYPYWDYGLADELKESVTQQHMDTLLLLQQLMSPDSPVQYEMRAGMRTEATKDKLVLRYEYSGEKQIPYMAGLEGFIGKPAPNVLRVTITLTADSIK